MDHEQDDIDWLGRDHARLGPFARAALGILLARDEWRWWRDPADADVSLAHAIPDHRRVTWGGDASVLHAAEWVDRRRAIAIGQAFEDFRRRERLWVKVPRAVWDWPGGVEAIDRASWELTAVLGPGRVFVEWKDRGRTRTRSVRAYPGQRRVVAGPTLPLEALSSRIDGRADGSPGAEHVHIALTDSVERLSAFRSAEMVVLYGEQPPGVLHGIAPLRKQLGTQCVVQVLANADKVIDWLRSLIFALDFREWHLSAALQHTAHESGIHCRVLASTQRFFFDRRRSTERITFSRSAEGLDPVEIRLPEMSNDELDRGDGSEPGPLGLVEVAPVPDAERAPSLPIATASAQFVAAAADVALPRPYPPQPPMERVLHGECRVDGQALRTWPDSGEVDILIDIRMKTPLHRGVASFPDGRIEWHGDMKRLHVHMFEVGREPVTVPLDLPRQGPSSIAAFRRAAGRSAVDLRFLVSDGAQVLQTARLKAAPNAPIRFVIESVVTPAYRDKRAFDVALLVNDSLGNLPSVTMIGDDGSPWFSPLSEAGTQAARTDLLNELEVAVMSPTAALDPLMLSLANKGSLLLRSLKNLNPAWPKAPKRVQLVTQSDVFFPLEYVYEGPVPASTKATLCPERSGCLTQGDALPGCAIREAKQHLCPMGFLGVSAVIERHAWRDGQAPRLWDLPGHTLPRHRIDDLETAEFAASDKADNFHDHEVQPHPVVRIKDLEASLQQKRVPSWASWQANVTARSPSLLVMLVHMHNQAVFVGADDGLNLGGIDDTYVGEGPVVIAIGCSTGLSEVPGTSLPAVLQSHGARVVVAAMTTVLGRHANRVAHDLALQLRSAARASSLSQVGQVVTRMRRQLLAEGLALGLAVVAFGDADIVLGRAVE